MMIAEGNDRQAKTITVQIERTMAWRGKLEAYAIGHRADASPRQRVLVLCDAVPGQRVEVAPSLTVDVPPDLTGETALLMPPVVAALRAWDQLRLEIGAVALVTPGLWAPILTTVARWYGATVLPLDALATEGQPAAGMDADSVSRVAAKLKIYPIVCVVELTGRADVVDFILEAVPAYANVLFAGPKAGRLTIDYYVNLHRKGLHLSSTILSPVGQLADAASGDLVRRASRLLASRTRAAECVAAMSAVQDWR